MNTVRFWINAFIPNSVCEQHGDIFVGTIPAPGPRFFAGDQREFSNDLTASARMHSEVLLSGLDGDGFSIAPGGEIHRTGESLEIDDDGNIINRAQAPNDSMHFLNLRGSQTIDPNGGVIDGIPGSVQIDFVGSASLPLVPAPDIDYSGTLVIDRLEGNVLVSGATNKFPAYEMYSQVDDGPILTLLQIQPVSPLDLFGEEDISFSGSVRVVL